MGKKKYELGRSLQNKQAKKIKKMREIRTHNAKTDDWA